jgi:hypothetical protein
VIYFENLSYLSDVLMAGMSAMSTMDPMCLLDSLTDKECDLIQELREIYKAGYDEERPGNDGQ